MRCHQQVKSSSTSLKSSQMSLKVALYNFFYKMKYFDHSKQILQSQNDLGQKL